MFSTLAGWSLRLGRDLKTAFKPSYNRVTFALRSAITTSSLCLIFFWSCVFQIYSGPAESTVPIVLILWTFCNQTTFIGGNVRTAGKLLLSGPIAVSLALLITAIPGARETWYLSAICFSIGLFALNLLTIGGFLGLKDGDQGFMFSIMQTTLMNGDFTAKDIVWFGVVITIAIPASLLLSSCVLWPRSASWKVLEDANFIVKEIRAQYAVVQQLQHGDLQPTTASISSFNKRRHKVLKKLMRMGSLITSSCPSEFWYGPTTPLSTLHDTLASGWALITAMRALAHEKPEYIEQSKEVAARFHQADIGVILALSNMATRVAGNDKSKSAADEFGQSAGEALREAVHFAYEEMLGSRASEFVEDTIGNAPSKPDGEGMLRCDDDGSRYNAYLCSCIKLAEYLDRLDKSVEGAVEVHSTRGFTHAKQVAMFSVTRFFHHLYSALILSWFRLWPTFSTNIRKPEVWHDLLRSTLSVSILCTLVFFLVRVVNFSYGFWILTASIVFALGSVGQSLYRGALRISGMLVAWGFSLLVLSTSYNRYYICLPFLFFFTVASAYIQNCPGEFSQVGLVAFVTFYVNGLGQFGNENWDFTLTGYNVLMVLCGLLWSILSLLLIFPRDGVCDPVQKLHTASESCFDAFDQVMVDHGFDPDNVQTARWQNMRTEQREKAEKILLSAAMSQHQYTSSKFHIQITHKVLGVFDRSQRRVYRCLKVLSIEVFTAVVSMRQLLSIGVFPLKRPRIFVHLAALTPALVALTRAVREMHTRFSIAPDGRHYRILPQHPTTRPSQGPGAHTPHPTRDIPTEQDVPLAPIHAPRFLTDAVVLSHEVDMAADHLCNECLDLLQQLGVDGSYLALYPDIQYLHGFVYLAASAAKTLASLGRSKEETEYAILQAQEAKKNPARGITETFVSVDTLCESADILATTTTATQFADASTHTCTHGDQDGVVYTEPVAFLAATTPMPKPKRPQSMSSNKRSSVATQKSTHAAATQPLVFPVQNTTPFTSIDVEHDGESEVENTDGELVRGGGENDAQHMHRVSAARNPALARLVASPRNSRMSFAAGIAISDVGISSPPSVRSARVSVPKHPACSPIP